MDPGLPYGDCILKALAVPLRKSEIRSMTISEERATLCSLTRDVSISDSSLEGPKGLRDSRYLMYANR